MDEVIQNNTEFSSTPLVPEIRIRLLREDSPLWRSFDNESDAEELPRPYWAFAWSGGQALARYVLDNPDTVKNRNVLDFGAGCGLTSIAAAKAGAARITASDIDPLSITAILCNAQENSVEVERVQTDLIYSENQGWDVVLAGDIWYDSRVAGHGLNWLRKLASAGIPVLTADPGRIYFPSKGMEELACYACRSVPDLEHPSLREVRVFSVMGEGV